MTPYLKSKTSEVGRRSLWTMLGLLLDWGKLAALVTRSPLASTLLRWGRGISFVSLWYGSICAGFLALYCPLLPLLIFHQKLFRILTDIIFATWEMYPAALMEIIYGTRIIVSGDKIRSDEASILIMNHRTRTDWNFLWAAMFHASMPLAHRLKFVLKYPIRHAPGPGWVMQLTCYMFIHRKWEQDKELLASALDYFRDLGHNFQVLLFPEGTDLTEGSRKRSHQYADIHGLSHYNYVLHPKTTGFVFLADRMRQNKQLDAIYDLTVGYPFTVPQQETDLLRGNFPQEVHFHVKRWPSSSIPNDEIELRSWLADIWKEKEQSLTDFYANGSFRPLYPNSLPIKPIKYDSNSIKPPSIVSNCNLLPSPDYTSLEDSRAVHDNTRDYSTRATTAIQEPHSNALYLALMFWTILQLVCLIGLFFSFYIRLYAILHIVLFVGLSIFSEGIHLIEIYLYRLKKRIFLPR